MVTELGSLQGVRKHGERVTEPCQLLFFGIPFKACMPVEVGYTTWYSHKARNLLLQRKLLRGAGVCSSAQLFHTEAEQFT